jgi:hypothetical protein
MPDPGGMVVSASGHEVVLCGRRKGNRKNDLKNKAYRRMAPKRPCSIGTKILLAGNHDDEARIA